MDFYVACMHAYMHICIHAYVKTGLMEVSNSSSIIVVVNYYVNRKNKTIWLLGKLQDRAG